MSEQERPVRRYRITVTRRPTGNWATGRWAWDVQRTEPTPGPHATGVTLTNRGAMRAAQAAARRMDRKALMFKVDLQ
jgi:hypothetical protein